MTGLLKPEKKLLLVIHSLLCHSVGRKGIYRRRYARNNMKTYWVYMMQSANGRALYTGVTNDLIRRVGEHKEGRGSLFTAKYKCHKLVYFEEFGLIDRAIVREKQIKSLSRFDKEKLIDSINPERIDLFEQ